MTARDAPLVLTYSRSLPIAVGEHTKQIVFDWL